MYKNNSFLLPARCYVNSVHLHNSTLLKNTVEYNYVIYILIMHVYVMCSNNKLYRWYEVKAQIVICHYYSTQMYDAYIVDDNIIVHVYILTHLPS